MDTSAAIRTVTDATHDQSIDSVDWAENVGLRYSDHVLLNVQSEDISVCLCEDVVGLLVLFISLYKSVYVADDAFNLHGDLCILFISF